MHLPGVATYRIRPGESEIVATPHSPEVASLVVTGYWRTVLPMAIQIGGREVLHASAVIAAAGAVGFCGVSMTGKSTIAYELSRRGYDLWGDDALAFEATGTSVDALSLPFELQLREPYVAERHAPATGQTCPALETRASLAAVCTLERAQPESALESARVRRLSPSEAFPSLLSHAYCYSLGDVERNRQMVDSYSDLATRVPVFSVVFRPGFEHVSAVLDAIEEAVGMRPRGSL